MKVFFFGHVFMIFVLLLFMPNCTGSKSDAADMESNMNALLFRTQTHLMFSEILQDSFEIQVSLPPAYYQTDTVYATIYSTDANRSFGIISGVVNGLSFPANIIPDLVVVGIGYPLTGLEDWAAGRHSHLTPTNDSLRSLGWKRTLSELSGREDLEVHSGKADKFLAFIQEELIPYIGSEYRVTKSDRALFGYSLGGLFTLYTLFKAPDTFQRYFAGSPSTWWDGGVIFDMEKEFSESHNDLNATLFMSTGGLEDETNVANMWRMDSLLRARNYEHLELHSMVFPGQIHQSCYPEAVTEALMTLYHEADDQ